MDRKTKTRRALDSVIDYLYWRGQQVETRDEWEDITVALQIVTGVKYDRPKPVETAYFWAFGISREKLMQQRRNREWLFAETLLAWRKDNVPPIEHPGERRLLTMAAPAGPGLDPAASGDPNENHPPARGGAGGGPVPEDPRVAALRASTGS